MDIGSIVSARLKAARALESNPHDVEALNLMHRSQTEVSITQFFGVYVSNRCLQNSFFFCLFLFLLFCKNKGLENNFSPKLVSLELKFCQNCLGNWS